MSQEASSPESEKHMRESRAFDLSYFFFSRFLMRNTSGKGTSRHHQKDNRPKAAEDRRDHQAPADGGSPATSARSKAGSDSQGDLVTKVRQLTEVRT